MNTEASYLLRLPRRTLDALQDLAIKKSRSTMPRRKITVKDLITEAVDKYLMEVERCRVCGAPLGEKYLDRLDATVPYCRECGESHE